MDNPFIATDLSAIEKAEPLGTDFAAIQNASMQLLQAVESAIDELSPKISMLGSRISQLREHISGLLKSPIPAAEFGEFVGGYVDVLAKKGKQEVLNFLNNHVANVEDPKSINSPKDFEPLSFEQIDALLRGERAPGAGPGQLRSLLPTTGDGSLSPEVMMYIFGDHVKTKLCELVTKQPVSYRSSRKGGFNVGLGMADRRAELELARAELAGLEAAYSERVSEMQVLQQKKRARR